jgi:hypothetical protein
MTPESPGNRKDILTELGLFPPTPGFSPLSGQSCFRGLKTGTFAINIQAINIEAKKIPAVLDQCSRTPDIRRSGKYGASF